MVTQVKGSVAEDYPIYVGSIAEGISGLTGVDGQAYQVTGWQAGTEIGGGNFVFRSAKAKSAHNGITVFSPTVPAVSAQAGATLHERSKNYRDGVGETDSGGSGCLVREYGQAVVLSPTIDAFWSGAEGIGALANDSTSAIQDCVSLIGAAGGGKLWLPKAGKFYTTSTISLVSNIEVFGGGVIVTDGGRWHRGLQGTDLENVIIDGIGIEAVTAETGFDTAILMLSCKNTTVKNCTINNIGQLSISAEAGHGIVFDAITEPPLLSELRVGVKILNNRITNIFGSGQNRGDHITVEGYSDVLIEGNYLNQCERMSIAFGDYVSNFKIVNNTIINAGLAGIDFEEDIKEATIHKGVVSGNYIENWGNQIGPDSIGSQQYAVDFHDFAREIVFSNNVCVAGANSRRFVYAINGAKDFSVTNNLFIGDLTEDAIRTYAGGSTTGWDISNNTFIGDLSGGIIRTSIEGYGCRFSNNRHVGLGGAVDGVFIGNQTDFICENNVIGGFTRAINLEGNNGASLGHTVIKNNRSEGFSEYLLRVRLTGSTIIDALSVHGNTGAGSTAFAGVVMTVATGGSVQNLTYSGNVFSGVTDNVAGNAASSADYNYVTNTGAVATPFAGQIVFSFDDNKLMQYDGAAWV